MLRQSRAMTGEEGVGDAVHARSVGLAVPVGTASSISRDCIGTVRCLRALLFSIPGAQTLLGPSRNGTCLPGARFRRSGCSCLVPSARPLSKTLSVAVGCITKAEVSRGFRAIPVDRQGRNERRKGLSNPYFSPSLPTRALWYGANNPLILSIFWCAWLRLFRIRAGGSACRSPPTFRDRSSGTLGLGRQSSRTRQGPAFAIPDIGVIRSIRRRPPTAVGNVYWRVFQLWRDGRA